MTVLSSAELMSYKNVGVGQPPESTGTEDNYILQLQLKDKRNSAGQTRCLSVTLIRMKRGSKTGGGARGEKTRPSAKMRGASNLS